MSSRGNFESLVAGLAAGLPQRQVAELSGLSVATVQRRAQDPAVKAAVTQVRATQLDRTVGRLNGLAEQALNRLERLLADPTPNVALKAVELALGAAERWRLLIDQDARIAALEARQDDTQNGEEDSDWARVGLDRVDDDERGTGEAAPQRHRSAA